MSFLRLAQDYDTLAYDRTLTPVAYLGFCEGGQSQRREVRGTGGANGVECAEGVSPPQKLKKFFLVQCVQKFFVFRPKGGIAQYPPKYATDSMHCVTAFLSAGGKGDVLHSKKVKFSHTRYRALGPELIPVYRQSARR